MNNAINLNISSNYYPFGSLMPGRHTSSPDYRYGFNGMEKDDEVKGSTGSSYDFGARMYDSRLGRWFRVDNYASKYPDVSPYTYSLNNPIAFADYTGDTVVVTITMKKVGTTKINLYSSGEIEANSTLKTKKKVVPVYEVNVTNEYGCSSTFYFTRVNYRGNKNNTSAEPTDVTFDVLNDGDKYLGKIKNRWGVKNYVLELRDFNNIKKQTIWGRKAKKTKKRTAIQMHVKGASDGCLLCVGSKQFESLEEGIEIDKTHLKSSSSGTQKSFMSILQEYMEWDQTQGKDEVIIIKFEQMYPRENGQNLGGKGVDFME